MAEENQDKMTPVQQIVQHVVNKEPSKLTNVVNKEIAQRVMVGIEGRKADIAKKIFGD